MIYKYTDHLVYFHPTSVVLENYLNFFVGKYSFSLGYGHSYIMDGLKLKATSLFIFTNTGKGFTTNSELRKHERRHAGLVERKFSCEICDKTYSTPQHLKVHKRRHTGAVLSLYLLLIIYIISTSYLLFYVNVFY